VRRMLGVGGVATEQWWAPRLLLEDRERQAGTRRGNYDGEGSVVGLSLLQSMHW